MGFLRPWTYYNFCFLTTLPSIKLHRNVKNNAFIQYQTTTNTNIPYVTSLDNTNGTIGSLRYLQAAAVKMNCHRSILIKWIIIARSYLTFYDSRRCRCFDWWNLDWLFGGRSGRLCGSFGGRSFSRGSFSGSVSRRRFGRLSFGWLRCVRCRWCLCSFRRRRRSGAFSWWGWCFTFSWRGWCFAFCCRCRLRCYTNQILTQGNDNFFDGLDGGVLDDDVIDHEALTTLFELVQKLIKAHLVLFRIVCCQIDNFVFK
jgi:hypothetical protein